MHTLISSFLIQHGHLKLAGIGQFEMQAASAVSDVASKMIYPPETNIVFKEDGDYTSEEFIAYTAYKTHTDISSAGKRVQEWIDDLIQQLDNHEYIHFPTIGKLVKNDEDIILFQSASSSGTLQPVPAERVIHEKDTHKVLVGDVESDSEKMNQLLHPETTPHRQAWWKAALIILIFTILLYIVHVFSGGSGYKIDPQKAPATYISK